MIGKVGLVQAEDFKVGLFTRSDIINSDPDLSPNCMDIQWYFDDSIGKRLGSTTKNTVALSQAGPASGFIVGNALTNNLISYWKLDESSGTRYDVFGSANLLSINNPQSASGIRDQSSVFVEADSGTLYSSNVSHLYISNSNFTFSFWVFMTSTGGGGNNYLIMKGVNDGTTSIRVKHNEVFNEFGLEVLSNGAVSPISIRAESFGTVSLNTWYNIVVWQLTNSHVGISVNRSVNTESLLGGINSSNSVFPIGFGRRVNSDNTVFTGRSFWDGRIDESGFWTRVLDATDRANLYAGGSGNTYTGASEALSWASFDFGASGVRWMTVCAGTGIMASSNLGTTFVNISTSRTANYQYLDRSKNVLIATSDSYDRTLYWAGSAGTFAVNLAVNSAPQAKFSVNYQGFCILLNSMDSNGVISNRRFSYVDENLQLTSAWPDGFDLPSSADDEITGPFILNKFLYVSTKYRIFRLNYTGGNPDWQYIQVKNFGYVPRTMKVFTLKQGQVCVGLDWSRRLRAFDGYDDQIISDNVENDNDYCDFAMQKISLAGSGLVISNAEFDPNEQEYRLNVAIGAQSTQTTHALVLNARTLAIYPYSNQPFNTMCVAESAGQQYLMAFDRSGFCHVLNSGNLDVSTPINEIYDSPLFFNKTPSAVTKNKQITFYFGHDSCGTIYFQERFDFSRIYSPMRPLRDYSGKAELLGTESTLQLVRSTDIPSVQNIYQFRLTTSAGTADPWTLNHFDYFSTGLGYGRGQ